VEEGNEEEVGVEEEGEAGVRGRRRGGGGGGEGSVEGGRRGEGLEAEEHLRTDPGRETALVRNDKSGIR
jgi:hypothetical protein